MGRLGALYARNKTPLSILLRNIDRWGRVSHCALIDAQDGSPASHVIEARALSGVVRTPLDEFMARYTFVEQMTIEVPDPAAGLLWAHNQIGMPYDWRAIAGNLFRESWQDPNAWQCAELVEMAVAHAGRPRFRRDIWRISPNNSAMVI